MQVVRNFWTDARVQAPPTCGLWEPTGLRSCLYQLQLLAVLMACDQVVGILRENSILHRTHKASWSPKLTRRSFMRLQLALGLWRLRLNPKSLLCLSLHRVQSPHPTPAKGNVRPALAVPLLLSEAIIPYASPLLVTFQKPCSTPGPLHKLSLFLGLHLNIDVCLLTLAAASLCGSGAGNIAMVTPS